jgi:hypothetical protein
MYVHLKYEERFNFHDVEKQSANFPKAMFRTI